MFTVAFEKTELMLGKHAFKKIWYLISKASFINLGNISKTTNRPVIIFSFNFFLCVGTIFSLFLIIVNPWRSNWDNNITARVFCKNITFLLKIHILISILRYLVFRIKILKRHFNLIKIILNLKFWNLFHF